MLEKLKSIIGTEFREVLGRFTGNKIVLFDKSAHTTVEHLEIKDNKLYVDLSRLTSDQFKQLKPLIIDQEVIKDNKPFLEDTASEKTLLLKDNLADDEDEKLLEFYSNKLSPDYLKALEMSLVVKKIAEKKGDIKPVKQDIVEKYPEFGRNLCNLTSEGYFHGHFKHLFNYMSSEADFNPSDYRNQVEKIVISLPFTVFINEVQSIESKYNEVKTKIENLRKYGTGMLLIHGLGSDNVSKAVEITKKLEEDKTLDISIQKTKTSILAKIKF